MNSENIVKDWFYKWESGNYLELPIAENFRHTSPFSTIDGKLAYLELVRQNEEKFIGHRFRIHDSIYETDRACVRYTTHQGKDFSLDVSEWYYIKDHLIAEIHSYYHIGEIREERKIKQGESDG